MEELSILQRIAVWALPVLFAITVHEVSHGWAARKMGDPTAKMLGRLSLNPIKHIDPVGTLLVPGLMLLLPTPFIFGWAKPVPVTWENLKHPKRDMALVAAAGPISNLVMGIGWALLALVLLQTSLGDVTLFLLYVAVAGIYINVILMVLNLLPLPPLDGGRVLAGLLPGPLSYKFSRLEPYGLIILVVLLFLGVLSIILTPMIEVVLFGLTAIAGMSNAGFYSVLMNLIG